MYEVIITKFAQNVCLYYFLVDIETWSVMTYILQSSYLLNYKISFS